MICDTINPISSDQRFPYVLRDILRGHAFENIIDSNIFAAYIPQDLPVPAIEDPRRTHPPSSGVPRHPAYVRSPQINQIFSYIGYIKRLRDESLKDYLPILFEELNRFYQVFVDLIFKPDVSVSEEIFSEQEFGLNRFLKMFDERGQDETGWIQSIWEEQRRYLDNLGKILKSLRRRGKIFDFRDNPLHGEIVSACLEYFDRHSSGDVSPGKIDISFVANSCLKAQHDGAPKTIWSSDSDIKRTLEAIYQFPDLTRQFPQIHLRAGYLPHHFKKLYPS